MGDRLQVDKTSRYVTSHLGQLSLPSLRGSLIEYQPFWLWFRRGALTYVRWQITLCDPIRQVTSRSSPVGFPFNLCRVAVFRAGSWHQIRSATNDTWFAACVRTRPTCFLFALATRTESVCPATCLHQYAPEVGCVPV